MARNTSVTLGQHFDKFVSEKKSTDTHDGPPQASSITPNSKSDGCPDFLD